MVDYWKYKLTQEDIDIGISDFFTQILIEARRQKKTARSIEDLSSDNPTIEYLVGQPGAGKTNLGRCIGEKYQRNGECVLEVGADKIATYHKYYDELIQLLPNECYTISREFVKVASPHIYQTIRDNRINIIREISLTKGEKDYNGIEAFKKQGYRVKINVMAVDKYESFLSCIERDIKLLELGYDPRPVERHNHDRMYYPFLQEIAEISRRGLCDEVNVYARGRSINMPALIYTTGETRYANACDAVAKARENEHKRIMSEPVKYLARIKMAREKINILLSQETMRKKFISQLAELEREFVNELSFDRNNNSDGNIEL